MPYLIDGHNLIHKIPGIDIRDPEDEIQLIKLLQEFCRGTDSKIEVFFDNSPPGSPRIKRYVRVSAHFVPRGRSADDAIRSRLKGLRGAARNWTVVTSDQEIIKAAKEVGAKVLPSERFTQTLLSNSVLQEQSQATHNDISLSPEEIADWLQLFAKRGDKS